jgi:glycosyltransferase involved in cell wall biosynthesis
MKVLHIIPDVNAGGASKGTYRIHHAVKSLGVDSHLLVLKKNFEESNIENVNAGISGWIGRKIYKEMNRSLNKPFANFKTENQALHSFGLARRGLINKINRSDADIIHLHWIANILSIEDIGNITKPIAWTFHDMWPICGAEHYVMDDSDKARFRVGYLKSNQPSYETGPDFSRLTWERKLASWKDKTFHIATCSHWLADCARSSPLFLNGSIRGINYPLDVEKTFTPFPKQAARNLFNLPQDKNIILAGAIDSVNSFYKGGDLLREAISYIANSGRKDIVVTLFGEKSETQFTDWALPVFNVGRIYDEQLLGKLYSAADVVIMPSRQEAFGQVASEAQACGTPAVVFNRGGPIDIVAHKETGYLAKPFDTQDLANGICWVLDEQTKGDYLSKNSRQRAVSLFAPEVAGQKYLQMYENMLKS